MQPILTPPTEMPSTAQPIQWGGIVKGAAIVAAVAVAAVVGYVAIGALAGIAIHGAMGIASAPALTHGIVAGTAQVAGWLGTLTNSAMGVAQGTIPMLTHWFGWNTAVSTATLSTAQHTAGIIGAAAAATVTASGVSHLHFTTPAVAAPATGTSGNLTSDIFAAGTGAHAATVGLHDSVLAETAHQAHSAHELSEEQRERMIQRNWSNQVASRGPMGGSFADKIREREDEKKPLQPRTDSYMEQVAKDRAAAANDDLSLDR